PGSLHVSQSSPSIVTLEHALPTPVAYRLSSVCRPARPDPTSPSVRKTPALGAPLLVTCRQSPPPCAPVPRGSPCRRVVRLPPVGKRPCDPARPGRARLRPARSAQPARVGRGSPSHDILRTPQPRGSGQLATPIGRAARPFRPRRCTTVAPIAG